MRFFKLLFILLVMLVGAAFAVMNAENVNLNYYFGSTVLPLSVVLVGAVCFGAVLGMLAGLGGLASLKRENASLRREARLASQEVQNLRTMPIKDD
ncbi:MAG: LapA family protein [Chromatiaceae bacterium]|nr:LapA family protein [Gammaproteobacteria bacterium]MCB1862074.1 LapA family protein [Gammaproteobacteria bacterium]MCB1873175.1 LapA family protein [Gammaproteobacteria bacterium]MCB1879634.1 LapA family protein [Gammaproteobacteria bacterium]MCP5448447.1 LapA family protein [Chromatiaceae bacterium]